MKIRLRRDLTSGLVLMLIMTIIWLMIPNHIVVDDEGINAQFFPRIIVVFMFVLALYICLKSIIRKDDVIIELDVKKS